MTKRVEVVSLEGDAEQIAEALISGSLPATFLDEIDMADDRGKARLIACLMLRQQQASLEKDEIVRFVARNRRALNSGELSVLDLLIEGSKQQEGGEGFSKFC